MKGHEVKFSKFSKSIYMKGHQLVSDNLVEIVCLWCLSGAAGAPEIFYASSKLLGWILYYFLMIYVGMRVQNTYQQSQ